MREILEHKWIAAYKRRKQCRNSILIRAMEDYDIEEGEEEKDISDDSILLLEIDD
jgi:hypothetical protein